MNHLPIEMEQFDVFLILKNISEKEFMEKVKVYSKIYINGTKAFKFKYFKMAKKNRNIVYINCCPPINFFDFCNLILWFYDYKSNGIMINKKNNKDSFYCKVDNTNPYLDTLMGAFSDNRLLFIDVPDSYIEKGNLQLVGYDKKSSYNNIIKSHLTVLTLFKTVEYKILNINA